MNNKISVIIPVYNVEKYLRDCLDSVLMQDFDSFEVIAVNDGSTDSSGDILSEYEKSYSNLLIINQENMGLGGARNSGINCATGKYLLFLDSDDTIAGGALSYLYKKAEQEDGDIVCFGINYVTEQGDTVLTYKASQSESESIGADEYLEAFANNSYVWNKLYKSELFKNNEIYFPQRAWYEDLATVPKLILHSKKIVLTDKIFYNYLQRSDSIMHVANEDRNIEMIEAVDSVLEYYKKNNSYERFYNTLEYIAVLHILVLATNRVASTNPKHYLLKKFNEYVTLHFPNYRKNSTLGKCLSFRRKLIYFLSKNKLYSCLYLLNKLNKFR